MSQFHKKSHSVFDYTITLTRKHRYLVVSSPEFGIQISSNYLDLDRLSAEEIGTTVLHLIQQINTRLHQLHLRGEPAPKPLKARGINSMLDREYLGSRDAAKALGISTATLRKMVKQGMLRAERTPGGHLRFSVDALAGFSAQASEPSPSVQDLSSTEASRRIA